MKKLLRKEAVIMRTKKYYTIYCKDVLGSIIFSSTGSSVVLPRKDVTVQWIGENLRKSLMESHDYSLQFNSHSGNDSERAKIIDLSRSAERAFWFGIRDRFGFKDHLAAMSKSAVVFVSWEYEQTDQICFLATRGRGAGHSAWYLGEDEGKVFYVSIHASDEEIASVALQALDACQPNYA
ncbi:hypothetical protein [Acetobacter malorum]|uniref:hypothetical protein n=1 Tax=Acetobacter malorum TaxID=178901 RepID=UPI00248E91FE|nr:hypothetical protein [Acetobacter malorum]